jgi:hypothetical protein
MVETFHFDIQRCVVSEDNKYHLKTGSRTGILQGVSKDTLKVYLPFKLQEGTGSPGGKCRGSNGFIVEDQVLNELRASLKDAPTELYWKIIGTLPMYKRDKVMSFTKRGKEDCRRPMRIDDSTYTIDFENNTCKNIADIFIEFYDGYCASAGVLYTSSEYISQKSTGLVTFINSGIKADCLRENEIRQSNITTPIGQLLLKTLGIDQLGFCNIFNFYNDKDKMVVNADLYNKSVIFDTYSDKKTYRLLEDLIKKSMGVGDSIISHRINNTDKIYKSKDTKINILSYKSYYGGKSKKAKRIDIELSTKTMKFIFNIRNKQGGVYPSHFMCDFKYI